MADTPLERAERHFAAGDYVQGVTELEKAASLDPTVSRRIQAALERMKIIAAREFAVGRWSVAEGIVDAIGEHARFLSEAERKECRKLVDEIQQCRVTEREIHPGLQAAALLASQGQYPQSREVALRIMGTCTDPLLVARLRRLLMGLPHPLGRLIYGFDSRLEIEQFVRTSEDARAEPVLDETHELGGGFAAVTLPRRGSGISLLDPPPDWSDAKEVSFLLRSAGRKPFLLAVRVGDLSHAWVHELRLADPFWNQVRLPLAAFRKEGELRWEAVTRFAIASPSDEPAEFWLDEIRLRSGAR
jgi:hypothetical protein